MRSTALVVVALAAAIGLQAAVPPALAQQSGLTFEQVQRKYRKMSPVFIEKCDHNGDGLFNNAEMQCVQGIYHSMYISK
jgi:hypothetical protein